MRRRRGFALLLGGILLAQCAAGSENPAWVLEEWDEGELVSGSEPLFSAEDHPGEDLPGDIPLEEVSPGEDVSFVSSDSSGFSDVSDLAGFGDWDPFPEEALVLAGEAAGTVLELGVPLKVSYHPEVAESGVFSFQPSRNGWYRFSSSDEGENSDPVLDLLDEAGQIMDHADDTSDSSSFSLRCRLEGRRTYTLKTYDFSRREASYTVLAEEVPYAAALSASLKEGAEPLLYHSPWLGEWEEIEGERCYVFYDSEITGLFTFTASYSDGTQRVIGSEEVEFIPVTPLSKWGPGGENLASFSFEEGSVTVSVPVASPQELYASLPVLEEGRPLSMVYQQASPLSGRVLFRPQEDGFYLLSAEDVPAEEFYAYVYDFATLKRQSSVSLSDGYDRIRMNLKAGNTYLFETFCEEREEASYTLQIEKTFGVVSLSASFKEGAEPLVPFVDGYWEEDEDEEAFFCFDRERIRDLYDFEALYSEGTRSWVYAGEVEMEILTPMKDWRPGGENRVAFTSLEGRTEVSVPVADLISDSALPVLSLGTPFSVPYSVEEKKSGLFLFTPAQTGTYRFTSSHEGGADPCMELIDVRSQRKLASGDDGQNSRDFSLSLRLEKDVTYLLATRNLRAWQEGSYSILAEKGLGVTGLTAALRNPEAALVYGRETLGYWDEEIFVFSESAILGLYDFTAEMEDGSRAAIAAEDILMALEGDWGLGEKNTAVFSYQGAEAEVRVPVLSPEKAYASLLVLEEGKSFTVSYDKDLPTSGCFLFRPKADGLYRFTSSRPDSDSDPAVKIYSLEPYRQLEESLDFSLKLSLKAGETYVVDTWEEAESPSPYEVLVQRARTVKELVARPKGDGSFLVFAKPSQGYWNSWLGSFLFTRAELPFLFDFTAVYEDGTSQEVPGSQVGCRVLREGTTDWKPGERILVRFSYEEGKCETEVPVVPCEEAYASLPYLKEGERKEGSYSPADSRSGALLFAPKESGCYRFTVFPDEEEKLFLQLQLRELSSQGDTEVMPLYEEDMLQKAELKKGKTYVLEVWHTEHVPVSYTVLAERAPAVRSMEALPKDPQAALVYGDPVRGSWETYEKHTGTFSYFAFKSEVIQEFYQLRVVYEDGSTQLLDGTQAEVRFPGSMKKWYLGGPNKVSFSYEEASCRASVPLISLSESQGGEKTEGTAAIPNPKRPKAVNLRGAVRLRWEPVEGAQTYRIYRKKVGSPEKAEYLDSTDSASYTDFPEFLVPYKYYVKTGTFIDRGIRHKAEGKSKSRFFVRLERTKRLRVKAGKGEVTLAWEEVPGASGYEVRYSRRVPTTGGEKRIVRSGDTLSLAPGTWYFTYRPFVDVEGRRIYGSFSGRARAIVF